MKPTILFVDDDPAMLEIFTVYFRDQGYEVATAQSGTEGRRLAEAKRFDLAVFDIHFANENGMELLTFFKTRFPSLPVVMLTGLPEDEDLVDEALARGASGFMRKQSSLADVAEAMRAYLPNS
ncbi:MAG: response regulator [Verrucomicrobiota bacterium]